jgi:hypothetical protein
MTVPKLVVVQSVRNVLSLRRSPFDPGASSDINHTFSSFSSVAYPLLYSARSAPALDLTS